MKNDDFDYYFLSDPRELSVYDSLVWADNFGHTVTGQAGMVLRTMNNEIRRLNRVIHAAKISDAANTFTHEFADGTSCLANSESSD